MKICLITDTHLGVRNCNKFFMKNQEKFFNEVFFPYIDEQKIDTIIHLGDIFDRRPILNYAMYDWSKKCFFNKMKERNLDVHIIVGNHDTSFRNTNFPNSPELVLSIEYNFNIYPTPTEVTIKNERMLFIPWVNVENLEETNSLIKSSTVNYLFGHLEIIGFQMLKGQKAEHGFDRKELKKFKRVFSGHFHHRSQEDNIWYLGNPYETTWADYENTKGFHILDLFDHSLEMIENPFTTHILINKVEDVTQEKLSEKIAKIDLTDMSKEDIDLTYKKIEKFEKRPESLMFINKTNFIENAEVDTDDLSIKSTKDIMYEYVESMKSDNNDYDKLKSLLGETYDKAFELI